MQNGIVARWSTVLVALALGLPAAACTTDGGTGSHDADAGRMRGSNPHDADASAKDGDARVRDAASDDAAAGRHDGGRTSGDAGSDAARADASQDTDDAGAIADASHDSEHDAATVSESCAADTDDGGRPIASTFTVPVGGGRFEVCTLSGGVVRFDFPASAAGLQVTATPVDPHERAWANPAFADAVRDALVLEPYGTVFSVPVKVRLPNGAVLGFMFDEASTGVPDPLPWSRSANTLELRRFSTLGIIAAEHSCDSLPGSDYTQAWSDVTSPSSCSAYGPKTTYRSYGCENAPFCYTILSTCCLLPGSPGLECSVDETIQWHAFHRAAPTAAYPYCNDVGSTPFVHSVTPSELIADGTNQTVTLTGNNMQPGGYVWGGSAWSGGVEYSSAYIVSWTWISSTEVEAVVSGAALSGSYPASLASFAYLNPVAGNSSETASDRQSNDFRVPLVRP